MYGSVFKTWSSGTGRLESLDLIGRAASPANPAAKQVNPTGCLTIGDWLVSGKEGKGFSRPTSLKKAVMGHQSHRNIGCFRSNKPLSIHYRVKIFSPAKRGIDSA